MDNGKNESAYERQGQGERNIRTDKQKGIGMNINV